MMTESESGMGIEVSLEEMFGDGCHGGGCGRGGCSAEQLVELCASKGPLIHCLTIGRAFKLADPAFDVLVQCTNLQVLNVSRTAAFRGADGGPGGKLLAKILTFCP
jgi:hypothetical protein